MFFRTRTMPSTDSYWDKLDRLSEAFAAADAVLIGEALMRAPDKKAKLAELRGTA